MHLLKVVRCRQEQHGMNYAWQMLEQYGVYTRHGNHWASSVDKGIHQSFCTCRHEKVKYLGTMTFDDFTAAAWGEKNLLLIT